MSDNNTTIQHLQIRQQNTNKSLTATADLLAIANTEKYDIIAIQEPYINFLGNARSSPKWYSMYPRIHYINKNKRMHSMILISKKIATNSWSAIDIGSPDVTAVKITTHTGRIIIYNLYCNCMHSDSLCDLRKHLQAVMICLSSYPIDICQLLTISERLPFGTIFG